MKKHVDFGHFILLKYATNIAPRFPLNHETNKNRAYLYPIAISNFLYIISIFFLNDTTQVGFLEVLMLFVVKGLLPIRIIESN